MAKAYLVAQEMSISAPLMDIESISGNSYSVQGMRRIEYSLRYVSNEVIDFPYEISTGAQEIPLNSRIIPIEMEFID